MPNKKTDPTGLKEFSSRFLNHFSIVHFFLKPVPMKEFIVIQDGEEVDISGEERPGPASFWLGAEHFNLLWLISQLTLNNRSGALKNSREPVIDYVRLRSVFFWYREADLSSKNRLDYLLEQLMDTGLIKKLKARGKSFLYLSETGKKEQLINREKRIEYISQFFEMSAMNAELRNITLDWFENCTPKLWDKIIEESASLTLKKERKKNK